MFVFQVFDEWNKGTLDSFLIEITANILRFKEDGKFVVDTIRDAAGQVSREHLIPSLSQDLFFL